MNPKHPLKAFREQHDPPLSQADLATMLDVSKAAVSRWEKGKRFPERQHWPRIKAITGLTAEELSESETLQ